MGTHIQITRLRYSGNEHKVICVPQSWANVG